MNYNKEGENYWIRWDEENQVVSCWADGIIDNEIADALVCTIKDMNELKGDSVNYIFDMSRAQKPTAYTRQYITKALEETPVGKFAYYGASLFFRTIVNFMTGVAGKNDSRHFATKENALQWIKGE